MDAETARLKDAAAALKTDEKDLRASLRNHASVTPLPELKASVASLREEKEATVVRLAKLKGGNIKPITTEEREKVAAEHNKWRLSFIARRKIRADMWKLIVECIPEPEKVAETEERLGLESM